MFGRPQHASVPVSPARPQLDLSGPRLRRALESLADGADATGGVERYADALKLKSAVFREALGEPALAAGAVDAATMRQLCAFMPTVRRRVTPWLEEPAFGTLRAAIVELT